jgi:hypothetical protein
MHLIFYTQTEINNRRIIGPAIKPIAIAKVLEYQQVIFLLLVSVVMDWKDVVNL